MLYNTERPHTFDDFVGQEAIVENIRTQAKNRTFFGVYLFGGHFGCGKTSMARLLALASNCEHPDENGNPCGVCKHCNDILTGNAVDIIELDAATNTGVDTIRDLRDTVSYLPANLSRKIYIIDEVHMLSKSAFNALLKVLEEPPQYVTFILCTTEVKSVPATIRSRAACYNFESLTNDELVGYLKRVAPAHEIDLDDDAAVLIAKYSQGAARNALSILDQVSGTDKKVTADRVTSLLGLSDASAEFELLDKLLHSDTLGAIGLADRLLSAGKDFSLICDDLAEIATDMLVVKIGGAISNTTEYKAEIARISADVSADCLCGISDGLHDLRSELGRLPGKTTIVSAIIRMTVDSSKSVVALTNRIAALERLVTQLQASPVGIKAQAVDGSVAPLTGGLRDELGTPSVPNTSERVMVDISDSDIASTENPLERTSESVTTGEDVHTEEEQKAESAAVGTDTAEPQASSEPANEEIGQQEEVDIFDIFDFDFSEGDETESDVSASEAGKDSAGAVDVAAEDTVHTYTPADDAVIGDVKRTLEAIAMDYPVVMAALKGCCYTVSGNILHIASHEPLIDELLRMHLQMCKDTCGMNVERIMVG